MPRGGQRPGAGRKPGSASISTTLVRDFLATKNFDPIAKLVELYNDEGSDHTTKVKIAIELAQYVAPKLKSLDVQGEIRQQSLTIVLGVPPKAVFPMRDGDCLPPLELEDL
jgi:hypothetical protein